MYLASLNIQHFRLIEQAALPLCPGAVVFCGPNASGKTSLLEAVYMLGTSRSFRTSRPANAVQHEADQLQIAVELARDDLPLARLSMRRGKCGHFSARIMQSAVRAASQLAHQLPLQLINPTVLSLVTQGPDARRNFIDLGLFHAMPAFRPCWQKYRQHLKQRNAWLRASRPDAHPQVWEQGLAEAGEKVAALRADYLGHLRVAFESYADQLLGDLPLSLHLARGWSRKTTLQAALSAGLAADRAAGHTRAGPHRADLGIYSKGHLAREVLSRGQQKLLVCALIFARERVLQKCHPNLSSVFLLDDLASELDTTHLGKVLLALGQISRQSLLTVLDTAMLERMAVAARSQASHGQGIDWAALFHIDQGVLTPVCST